MTNKKQSSKSIQRTKITLNLDKGQQIINLHIDIMFVNKIPFLVCKSDSVVNHLKSHFLPSRSKSNICKKLKLVRGMYHRRGFNIGVVYADNEFDFDEVKSSFQSSSWEICAKGGQLVLC